MLKYCDLFKMNGVYMLRSETNSWLKFIVYGYETFEIIMLNEVDGKLYLVPEMFKTDDNNFDRVNMDFKLVIHYSGFPG